MVGASVRVRGGLERCADIKMLFNFAHERAKSFARSAAPSDHHYRRVLTEYLNCFAGWGLKLREKAALNVQSILQNRTFASDKPEFRFKAD
jgi:hypothetical protein